MEPIISHAVFNNLIGKILWLIKYSVHVLLKFLICFTIGTMSWQLNGQSCWEERDIRLFFVVHGNKFSLHDFNQREHDLSQISETLISACFWRECVGVYLETLKTVGYTGHAVSALRQKTQWEASYLRRGMNGCRNNWMLRVWDNSISEVWGRVWLGCWWIRGGWQQTCRRLKMTRSTSASFLLIIALLPVLSILFLSSHSCLVPQSWES